MIGPRAFVAGNAAYAHWPHVVPCAKNAVTVAEQLQGRAFGSYCVQCVLNATQSQLEAAAELFAMDAEPSHCRDVLFYFAGRVLCSGGDTWLLATDATRAATPLGADGE